MFWNLLYLIYGDSRRHPRRVLSAVRSDWFAADRDPRCPAHGPLPFQFVLVLLGTRAPTPSLSPSPPTSLLAYLPPRLSPSSSLYSSLVVGPTIVGDVWYIVGDGAIYGKFFFFFLVDSRSTLYNLAQKKIK